MVRALLAGAILLPALGSIVLALWRRMRSGSAHLLTMAISGAAAICTSALLPYHSTGVAVSVDWLPGMGSMGLSLGATGLYATLATVWMLVLALWGSKERTEGFPRLSGAILLLALAGTHVAFLTDHFLARYVALEMIALCVGAILLVDIEGAADVRVATRSYLLLRVGDAGLLTGILILLRGSGTLDIGTALGAAAVLDATLLKWAVAGFVLAIWVKLGAWPFHLWSQSGRHVSMASHAWLYATVMPNLGMYLLYRISPLLLLDGSLQSAVLWLGAGGATVAALSALMQADPRSSLVHVGAAQGGIVLVAAATGSAMGVWLCMLALTPLRMLLFLAADAAQNPTSPGERSRAAWLFGLGASWFAALNLLATWWARQRGAPLDVLLVTEAAVALLAVWAVHLARRLANGLTIPSRAGAARPRWIVLAGLTALSLVWALVLLRLTEYVALASNSPSPPMPTPADLFRHALASPAMWMILLLAWAVARLRRRSMLEPMVLLQPEGQVYDLEEGLTRAAQALRAVVEVGILEYTIVLAVRTLVGVAQVSYRVLEQGGLEGLLRRSVQSALAFSRGVQRWHTGRLRRNLLWVSACLVLAVLTFVMCG